MGRNCLFLLKVSGSAQQRPGEHPLPTILQSRWVVTHWWFPTQWAVGYITVLYAASPSLTGSTVTGRPLLGHAGPMTLPI